MDADVLVVGAGPVGLMVAIELRRRGIDVIVVERRPDVAPWAKAVGVQPRTLEIFDQIGVVVPALDAATPMRGQLVYVNGEQVNRLEMRLPDEVPYHFVSLPQYETERVLGEHLAGLGTEVRRGVEFLGFEQDGDGVTAEVQARDGTRQTLSVGYLVGADGAHSLVRKGLGLSFDGDAFPEEYMLADVEVDWSMPTGYAIRSTHQTDGRVDDALVCIPLPGRGRYRMSMLVPADLATAKPAPGAIVHGLEDSKAPELHHIQAVLDRLSPEPTTAHTMRWSSVFRISHRLVDRYGAGRAFVAGDAAHIHPPTGAQGMNTGLQDAYNLGWKLALAVQGKAAAGLLESYHGERHPVGAEVVGRTVRAAREGIGAGEHDPVAIILREAQLLVGYPDSPLVADARPDDRRTGPGVGLRAPDAAGLRQDAVGYPIRWHERLRHPGHSLLIWAPDAVARDVGLVAAATVAATYGADVVPCVVVPAGVDPSGSGWEFVDARGNLADAYGFGDEAEFCAVRPDGYLGYRGDADLDRLRAHLALLLNS